VTNAPNNTEAKPRSRLVQSIASNWASLAVNIAISFFLAPFVVNKLGSTWYGIWAVVMQFTGYLYLMDFGVRESVIRYTSKYMARKQGRRLNQILTVAFGVYGPITVLTLIASVTLAWAAPYMFQMDAEHYPAARWTILLVGITIAQTFISNVFLGILLGLQRWAINNLVGITIALIRTAVIVVALKAGHGIVALATIQLGGSIVSGIVSAILASRYLHQLGTSIRIVRISAKRFRALASRVFRYGLFVFLGNIGQKIIVASDAIIIAIFMKMSSVTYYAIAGSLIDPLRSLLASTALVFAPIASKLHATGNRQQLGKTAISGSKLILVIALPVVLTYMILGRTFIGLWMGPEFSQPSGAVLMILAWAMLASTPSFVLSMLLYGISQHNISAYLKLIEAAVNLILSIVLAQHFGIIGVALGTAIPHTIVSLVVLPYLTCRAIGLPLRKLYAGVFTGPLLAALPLIAAELWVHNYVQIKGLIPFFAIMAIICAIYALSVYLLALDREERTWVLNILKRRKTVSA
jgi:O-antigen/teichoic acid export membrane protein